MEKEILSELIVIQIFIIVTFITIFILIAKVKHNIYLDRKFSKYTITPINDVSVSFFDIFNKKIIVIIKKISYFLKKTKLFHRYAIIYEKHIDYENRNKQDAMDYISVKFIFAFVLILLYFISSLFKITYSISIIGIILCFIVGFFLVDVYIQFEYHKKRKQIEEDLLKSIIIMNNSFASGRSITQAIEIVKDELEGPISDEFKKIYLDLSYGLSIEVVFDRFYKRVKLEDVKYISASLTLLNKTGGNIVKVFESIEKEFFNKKKLNNELKMMTSSSLFVFRLLLIIPVVLYLVIFILNKDYFSPLFNTPIGLGMTFIIIVLYSLYILIVKKIIKVDV